MHIKIGMRTVKTAIAITISLLVVIIFKLLDNIIPNISSMYTPFYAGIAAIYATHNNPKLSLKQAKIRCFGSIYGGYFGMLILYLSEFILINILSLNNELLIRSIKYIVVGLSIIPLFHVTVLLKNTQATFITGLTFLSVTVSSRNGGMNPFMFATNRVLSTLIGLGISLAINNIQVLFHKNKQILFVSSLDNNLLNQESEITPYLKYKLNIMYTSGMNLTFVTTRTLTSLNHIFTGVNVLHPIVIMNGSAVYDYNTQTFLSLDYINPTLRILLEEKLKKHNLQAFSYTVCDNMMYCYHNNLINDGEIDFYNKRIKRKSYGFVKAELPNDLSANLYVIIDEKQKVLDFINDTKKLKNNLDFVYYDYEIPGYLYLKINEVDARKEIGVEYIKKQLNTNKLIVSGSKQTDIYLMKHADLSICLKNAIEEVKEAADIIIDTNDPKDVLKLFTKLYYTKNLDKYIQKHKKQKDLPL